MPVEMAAFFLLSAAAVRDIRRRELARWMLIAAGTLSGANVLLTLMRSAQKQTTAAGFLLSLLPGAALLALAFLSREGIGYGDGWFALLLGPVFGWERMAAGICLAFFLSAVCSVILLILRRVGRKSCLPFVPFLASAMGVVRYVL